VTFEVAAEAYDRFMGGYSRQLSPQLADLAGVRVGQRVLDVGCGPGALTAELVGRVGADAVSAVDPSESFVAAARDRFPAVDVQRAAAEHLPFADKVFDAVLAQLVVHFMTDPVAGIREMKRVSTAGGAVAACVWDHAGARAPLTTFWAAARELDPEARDESHLAGAHEGHLRELFEEAGLTSVEETSLEASADFASFDEWWEPFTLGVGPAGVYAQTLDEEARARLRARCEELLPAPPFTLSTWAWAVRGVA
jgi:ubiquinone/menaquinone biosynthesis C-methylase UbiE